MKASTFAFRAAVCLGLIGIAAGVAMAASHNHAMRPAHAHINLVGWVSLFLIGIFYRLHSALDSSRLAMVQVGTWTLGTVVMVSGVALIYGGYPQAEPIAAIGSLIVLAAMLIFTYLVFRPEHVLTQPRATAAPAE